MATGKTILNVPGLKSKSPWFIWRLYHRAEELGVSPDCIALTMWMESGLNGQIINSIGAAGLIQVTPESAARLGYSISDIVAMTDEEQLDNVVFKRKWPKSDDCGEIQLGNFLPAYLGDDDSIIIGLKRTNSNVNPSAKGFPPSETNVLIKGGQHSLGAIYESNWPYDLNKDGVMTCGEVRQYARNKFKTIEAKYGYIPVPDEEPIKPEGSSSAFGSMLLMGAIVAIPIYIMARTAKGK